MRLITNYKISSPTGIQKILDHSRELCDRSILLHEQSKLEAARFEQLLENSLLLCEEGKRCPHHAHGGHQWIISRERETTTDCGRLPTEI